MARLATSSRSMVTDTSFANGSFSFGFTTWFDPPDCDTKSGPFTAKFTSPGWYVLSPLRSCHRYVVVVRTCGSALFSSGSCIRSCAYRPQPPLMTVLPFPVTSYDAYRRGTIGFQMLNCCLE